MRRLVLIGALSAALVAAPAGEAAASPRIAALQVALRVHGHYAGPIDGISGPLTRKGLVDFQRGCGVADDGKLGRHTRRALGAYGVPLLGRRELWVGRFGWDVASLEFRLRRMGLRVGRLDGRFDASTAAALRRFQQSKRLVADGIAGTQTYRALFARAQPKPAARSAGLVHLVEPGESFFSIAQHYRVSPWQLARVNRLALDNVIVPRQRLRLPSGATTAPMPEDAGAVRSSLDRWSAYYGVDARLARALAWMESGFQNHVVSSVGAMGVMQLLPETWSWVETFLIGETVPRTADGNVRVGVRYLRWQLDQFRGDVRLALGGWYQGARAVRQDGLYGETEEFVRIVQALYGRV
jgi:Transglycosylase SLT domain/Putative peptidoglycan binding domain/LysM domain